MNFQTRCNRYLQRIHQTQTTGTATPELSLFPHLQTFLEELFAIIPHLQKENLALCTHRSLRSTITWQHVLVADGITDGNCISNKDGPTHVFPLYLYPNPEELGLSIERSVKKKHIGVASV